MEEDMQRSHWQHLGSEENQQPRGTARLLADTTLCIQLKQKMEEEEERWWIQFGHVCIKFSYGWNSGVMSGLQVELWVSSAYRWMVEKPRTHLVDFFAPSDDNNCGWDMQSEFQVELYFIWSNTQQLQ